MVSFWFILILFKVHLSKNEILNNTEVSPDEGLISCSPIKSEMPLYEWIKVTWPSRTMPPDAVIGGIDSPHGCGKVYVGRTLFNGQLLPCKICGLHSRVYLEYNGTEEAVNEAEVLCSRHVSWKPVKEGEIPSNAFEVSSTNDGEKLYAGRGFVDTLLIPGKVMGNSRTLYMTYNQEVYTTLEYEILSLG